MIEEFKWRTQIQDSPTGEFKHRIKEVAFGDGYKQVSGDGLNTESQSWGFTYTGHKSEVMPIFSFIRSHTAKSFIWVPPFGDKGLYRVKADSITLKPIGGSSITITATFEQAFSV
ncbi:TPA: phage tail protein [Providencia alcalifaciens]|uniref:Phage tail protein n=3 Tax=Providencia alcalifaciens TaxID=126385 RepID=A0AAW9VF43_9GAMM|nr:MULTISPECIES: phage tail protein [Providencia]ATG16774.1 phage tail protein [Providencia alcalifaciens]EEB45647.1 phage minor tail protein [Providencia alcalifaciens DSM 30120]EUD12286.1 phage minor tail protein [Providencia alcalifaciens 205/92]MBF0690946.1 phage tail protein [Providencia alcalifaciens]MTC14019.1 phage tail protein [Providencia alcalifaciens]